MIRRIPRRTLMYLLVAAQVLVLGAIVTWQEVNRALDSGVGVDLEIVQARAHKDPFRGAHVAGQSALDLDGRTAAVPEGLKAGDRVLVFFAVEAGRRPRITRVERQGWDTGPRFSPPAFSIPGTVRESEGPRSFSGQRGNLLTRAGSRGIPIELRLPATIPVDDAALDLLAGPSLIRASLHQGFFGHRYLADVRLIGRAWTHETSFAWDEGRERLVVLAPSREGHRTASAPPKLRSEVFFFDAAGKEASALELPGRLIEGAVTLADGHLIAVISDEPWGYGTVALARIREDGQVSQRSPPIAFDRVLGFDEATGAVWVLTGQVAPRPQPPHSVERLTPGGPLGPRLGPFASIPRTVLSRGQQAWVVEQELHRVTRVDLSSGSTVQEFRDLNGPTEIAVDAGSLFVIEADHTQLTRLAPDGRVLWRVPRFHGLAWILPEPGTGGGWVGATRFEGRAGGVFRFGPDGGISRLPAAVNPLPPTAGPRRRLGANALRDPHAGRLYVREADAIAIVGADGALLGRVDGFRYPREQRVRN